MKNLKKNSGFTFIEIAIVVVIVGLLLAGITAGSEIMNSSRVSKVVTDANIYKSAVITFRDNYNAMPGDLSTATSYWGKDTSKCNSADGNASATGTCNGMGDGTINLVETNGEWESYRAWQHLSLAGFIKGSFDGTGTGGTNYTVELGRTIPQSTIKNAGFTIYWSNFTDLTNISSSTDGQNVIALGATVNTNNPAFGAALDANDSLRIDTKFDDGLPNSGDIIGSNGDSVTGCTGSNVYNSTTNILTCRIGFVIK
jgi:prepilin-type N-terminal cleavage/methylation domain-containing protein